MRAEYTSPAFRWPIPPRNAVGAKAAAGYTGGMSVKKPMADNKRERSVRAMLKLVNEKRKAP